MKQKIAIVAGGTGLIGNILVRNLLEDDDFKEIITLSRRETEQAHSKLNNQVVDFSQLSHHQGIERADIAFCCLGTTMKKAGSKEAFYKVDYDYVFNFAQYAFQLGCQQFYLVSAMGADRQSFFYYNRVKGEIEAAIATIGFPTVHVMRPSLLLGDRQEQRFGEQIGQVFAQTFSFLIPNNYKGIPAENVANYMQLLATSSNQSGFHIHESAEILNKGS